MLADDLAALEAAWLATYLAGLKADVTVALMAEKKASERVCCWAALTVGYLAVVMVLIVAVKKAAVVVDRKDELLVDTLVALMAVGKAAERDNVEVEGSAGRSVECLVLMSALK